jgi:hypothetical protein
VTTKFRPKPLPPESYEAPMEPHWRVMGEAEEKRLHEQAIAEHRRFLPFGPRARKRLLRYVLGSAAGFFLCCFFLVKIRFTTCLTYAGVGAGLGVVVAYLRPSHAVAAVLYGLFGVAAGAIAGLPMLATMFSMFAFVVVGAAVGIGEDAKRMDFDD